MSALAFWSYHRRLSLDSQRIKYPESDVFDNPNRRKQSVRTESESSTSAQIPPEDRRVSLEPLDSDDDDQPIEAKKPEESEKRKRRFSIDFLFSKKDKDKQKAKKNRSKSVSVPAAADNDDPRVREFRYPGIHNADFASLYFF